MRAAPLVLGDDTRIVGAQDATDSHCEVRKAFPMLAIAFRRLLWTDVRFRYTYNVVETIWRHATEQRIHILLALRADVFAQHRHALRRN